MYGSIVNVGVIGLGLGMVHLQAYQNNPSVRLLALADRDEQWLNNIAKSSHTERVYTDYKELLANPDIDAVSICLPNPLHAEATIAALEAGKHVLCEKPMAVTLAEAEVMHAAAVKTGKKLMISHNQRFGADVQFLKKQAESGFFGDIYFIRTGWRRPMGMMPGPLSKREDGSIINRNWFHERAKGGGVLRDLGSHMIDVGLYLSDFPALIGVYGSCSRHFYPDGYESGQYTVDSEDFAAAHLKFANGLSMELEVNFGSHIEDEVVFTEIYGTMGGASRRNGKVKLFTKLNGGITSTFVKKFDVEVKSTMDRFIECIILDTEPPVTSAQGVDNIRILEAIYESAGFKC